MPMASEALSSASAHKFRSSSKVPVTLAWTRQAVPHSMVRGAMRIAVRPRSSSGSASAIRRARSQLTRAAPMSRLVDQPPARMCQPYAALQLAGRFEMFGDQCRVLLRRFWRRRLRSRRPAADAIGRDRI